MNRGLKLRINSFTPRPTLINHHEEYVSLGRKRVIKQQLQLQDPYELVEIEQLWKVVNSLQDLNCKSFKSRHTQLLSLELMKIVEELYPLLVTLVQLSKSLNQFNTNTPFVAGLSTSGLYDNSLNHEDNQMMSNTTETEAGLGVLNAKFGIENNSNTEMNKLVMNTLVIKIK